MNSSTATVQKIITEILASPDSEGSIAFGKDARDLLIDCCVEFITLISSEANEISEKESKKTIAPEHIDKALRELGFPEYVREVLASAGDMKESLKVCTPFSSEWGFTQGRQYETLHLVAEPYILTASSDRLGKRRRVRWIRADCRRRSYCYNSKSYFGQPPANSIRHHDQQEYEGILAFDGVRHQSILAYI